MREIQMLVEHIAVYEYLHKRQIDRTAEVAACQALYKNK